MIYGKCIECVENYFVLVTQELKENLLTQSVCLAIDLFPPATRGMKILIVSTLSFYLIQTVTRSFDWTSNETILGWEFLLIKNKICSPTN